MSPIGPLNPKGYTLSNLILTDPRKHTGHPAVQPDTYKVHYRGLYVQTRRYDVKTTKLG